LSDAPVKARAVDAGLPVLQPERMKDPAFLDALAAWTPISRRRRLWRILTEAMLATPRLGMINVHASLLPAIAARRRCIGRDRRRHQHRRHDHAGGEGAGCRRHVREGAPADRPDELATKSTRALAQMGARLLVAVVDQIARGSAVETPQNDAESTYAHRLTREDGAIDWSWPAARVHNLIRGLHPWPHAFSFVQGKRSSCGDPPSKRRIRKNPAYRP